MKKIRLFGLILAFIICINCTDEEHPPITIIGKWKLIEVGGMVVTDYASNNIIYDFQPNGSLIVQSDVGERNGVYETGNYKYELEPGDPVLNFEAYTFFTNVNS